MSYWVQATVNMLFKENITTKEQMVSWLNKRRPSFPKGAPKEYSNNLRKKRDK
jgi:hypothetical protein